MKKAFSFHPQPVLSMNTTMSGGNQTNAGSNATTMATGNYSSSANFISPTGTGVSLQSAPFSLLLPVVMATSLLNRYC